MYIIDQETKKPIYLQLYEQIKYEIENNLNAGEKLPSIRKMSLEYKISKNTIQTAYNQLYAEGYIDSRPQSGYFVSEDLYDEFKKEEHIDSKNNLSEEFVKYDFYPACLADDIFPKKTWLRLYNKVMKSELNMGVYHNSQGDIELRDEISKYLASSRGVNCSAENIIIASGFSDSMFIISTILRDYTKTLAMEAPSYRVTQKVFKQNNFDIEDIPITSQGIDTNILKDSKAKLLYVTPSHQYFFGITTPIANRIEIINWAKENDSYIIEDDYDSELSYYNRPVPAMQGINNNKRVIYTGTFSKSFSPALRVSYLVLPEKLLHLYKKEFDYMYSSVSIDIQKTLALFIKEGFWDRHLRKVRTINKKKHDIIKEFVDKNIKKDVYILREGSGLNLLLEPKKNIDIDKLIKVAKENYIKLYLRNKDKDTRVLSMGFGGFKEEDLKEALEVFKEVWQKAKI